MTTMKTMKIYPMPGPTTRTMRTPTELVDATAQLRYCAEARIPVAAI